MDPRKKLMLVAGARPNFMKIAPIIRELERQRERFRYELVHTGQHYDKDMSEVFFEELEIPRPHHNLEVGSGSHAQQTAAIMSRFEPVCVESAPDIVLVVGDVNSTLACSIVAKKLNVEVGHVEAGLRSGDLRMPEEINRIVTDSISDLFFVTEPSGVHNLQAEGKPAGAIFFVGHVMIDNLYHQVEKLKALDTATFESAGFKSANRRYGVVTLHRPSNVDEPAVLSRIVDTLGIVAAEIPLLFAVHPRTAANLERFGIALPPGITRTGPLPYMEFLNLWKDAALLLTDSGGLQEETTALGIPCITLRENTERPVTVTNGTNRIVGSDSAKILAAAQAVMQASNNVDRMRPELWDGQAAVRIVNHLHEHFLRKQSA